jgi:peptidyl-prolyl cis-trans isomerase C
MNARTTDAGARIDGVPLHESDETPSATELRQRACTELLRQAAMREGLLAADDPAPQRGVISEAAADAIEALLGRMLDMTEPDDEACRRHHAARAARFAVGERVRLRHLLYAVTPGVDVNALRARAESRLIDLRAGAGGSGDDDRFTAAALAESNCPSGAEGGDLGWVMREDCAPEFSAEVFGRAEIGVLPRLVTSRFGLHVIEVLAREPGHQPPYDAVRAAVAQSLRQQAHATALRKTLARLAGEARVEGIDLDAAAAPRLR